MGEANCPGQDIVGIKSQSHALESQETLQQEASPREEYQSKCQLTRYQYLPQPFASPSCTNSCRVVFYRVHQVSPARMNGSG